MARAIGGPPVGFNTWLSHLHARSSKAHAIPRSRLCLLFDHRFVQVRPHRPHREERRPGSEGQLPGRQHLLALSCYYNSIATCTRISIRHPASGMHPAEPIYSEFLKLSSLKNKVFGSPVCAIIRYRHFGTKATKLKCHMSKLPEKLTCSTSTVGGRRPAACGLRPLAFG